MRTSWLPSIEMQTEKNLHRGAMLSKTTTQVDFFGNSKRRKRTSIRYRIPGSGHKYRESTRRVNLNELFPEYCLEKQEKKTWTKIFLRFQTFLHLQISYELY